MRSPRNALRGLSVAIALVAGVALATSGAADEAPQHTTEHAAAEHAGGAAEHSEAGHSTSIMNVEPGLMFWTAVTFVVLLVVLWRTAWKPLVGALEGRAQRIRAAIEDADRVKKEAEAVLVRYEEMLDGARTEAQKIIEEGKSDAQTIRNGIVRDANNDAAEIKARARREIDLATDAAKKELWEETTRLSTLLAERILQRSLDDNDHRRLIEEFLSEFRSGDVRTSDTPS